PCPVGSPGFGFKQRFGPAGAVHLASRIRRHRSELQLAPQHSPAPFTWPIRPTTGNGPYRAEAIRGA
ncbi:MAG: hypothetical protein ACKOJF_01165, partial [Planctomycetaceae bacterium]